MRKADGEGRGASRSRFPAPLFETARAARWPLAGLGGLAIAFIATALTAEEGEVTFLDVPDRFTQVAPPEATVTATPRPPPAAPPIEAVPAAASPPCCEIGPAHERDEIVQQSPLLLELIGAKGTSSSALEDLFDPGSASLGDLDAALSETRGVTTSSGAASALGTATAVVRPRVRASAGSVGHRSTERALKSNRAPEETWPQYGVNAFVDPVHDRFSTFSVDVDTASWTRVRRSLAGGALPSQGMVRVEEFLNYFPYDYAPPLDGQPFTAHIQGAPSPYAAGRHLVRVGLQGRKVSIFDRRPAHLTFLVDVSCSMQSDDKLPLVQHSLHRLTDELVEGDTVALVTYAGQSEIVLEPTTAADAGVIHAAIDRLSTSGSTAMADGIFTAYALADRLRSAETIDRVIVASDGDANVGPTQHHRITPTIQTYAKRGITLTTLGFGTGNYRDGTMEQLANDGDGNYYYVDGPREAERVLVDRLTSTLEVIARDTKIQVEWNPEAVASYRLVGYENRAVADRDFRNDQVDAGEVGAGHQVTALYELILRNDVHAPLGALRMRVKPPGEEAPSAELAWPIDRTVLRTSILETDASFRVAAAAAGLAETLRGSPWTPDVTLDTLEALATSARRVEYDEDHELVQAIQTVRKLRAAPAPRGNALEPNDQILVERTIHRYRGQLKYCYEKRLKAIPTLQGRIEVGWGIREGEVTDPVVILDTTADADLADCVTQKIRRWRFPDHVSGDVSWPFRFSQR